MKQAAARGRGRADVRRALKIINLSGFARFQDIVASGRDRHGDDPPFDPVKIDLDLGRRDRARGRGRSGRLLRCDTGDGFGGQARLLVAFPGEGIGRVLGQGHDVNRARQPGVELGQVEPLIDRTGIGRGEKVKELAGGVENRPVGLAQTVGHGERLVLGDGIDEDPLKIRGGAQGIGQPFSVGRPGRRTFPPPELIIGPDFLDVAFLQVENVNRPGVVMESDPPAVGRPDRRFVEAGAGKGIAPGRPFSVLGTDLEGVFPGGIGEIRDRFSVGRPERGPFMGPRRPGQVAGIPFLGRDGHDLAPELEDGPGPGGRELAVADPLGPLGRPLPELGRVGRDPDLKAGRGPGNGVKEMKRPGLLVNDPAVSGRGAENGEILMAGQGLDFPGPGVVAVNVELPVPVGPKVDLVPDPHRAGVVAAALGLGDFFVRQVVEVDDPDS
ncbi:MAG: hypothetical protein BWX98_02445 [Candidatus Aminicenantes bacterium ADurb.Bin147]|nr:MAG: hypothetical protein BWX98_02445 [Candidatus Aminicenantes bacterium ADurb.Bin147]